jgi:crooked neck
MSAPNSNQPNQTSRFRDASSSNNTTNTTIDSQSGIKTETFVVKNRLAAEKQITLEQLMRDAQNYLDTELISSIKTFHDQDEVDRYTAQKRATFEQHSKGRGKGAVGMFIEHARWEAKMQEFDRSRAVFEDAISFDPHNQKLWLLYINMEISHGAVQSARNIFRKATQIMPNSIDIWFKWIELEEKMGNNDNIRAIYTELSQPRLETGSIPPVSVFDSYIDFETRQKQFQNVVKIFEEFLSLYPTPSTYTKYAQFSLYNGHLVDISTIYSTVQGSERSLKQIGVQSDQYSYLNAYQSHLNKNNVNNDDNGNNMEDDFDYEAQLLKLEGKSEVNFGKKKPLTPRIVFERALKELKIVETLSTASEFENLHLHLLISQLQIANTIQDEHPKAQNLNVSNFSNFSHFSHFSPTQFPSITTTQDIITAQDRLLQYNYPKRELVDDLLQLLLFWAQLEEELISRKFHSKSTQNSQKKPNQENTQISKLDMSVPREILYYILKYCPLRLYKTTLQALFDFEKRNGDSSLLDQALLHLTRYNYKEQLGISYVSLLKLIIIQTDQNIDKTTKKSKKDQSFSRLVPPQIPYIPSVSLDSNRIVNGRRVIDIPILGKFEIAKLQFLVRDYDLWLDWVNIERRYIQDQTELYSLYSGTNIDLLAEKYKKLNRSNLGEKTNKNDKKSKKFDDENNDENIDHNNPFTRMNQANTDDIIIPVPDELSYLHNDIIYVFETALKFLPVAIQTKMNPNGPNFEKIKSIGNSSIIQGNHLITSFSSQSLIPTIEPPSSTHLIDPSNPNVLPTFIISPIKSDWKRFTYLILSYANYLELFQTNLKKTKEFLMTFLTTTVPKNFTFSNLWIHLALLQLRIKIDEYQVAIHGNGIGSSIDYFGPGSEFYENNKDDSVWLDLNKELFSKIFSKLNLLEKKNNNYSNFVFLTDRQKMIMKRELYPTTIKDVRAIFGRAIGFVKNIIKTKRAQNIDSIDSIDTKTAKTNFNVKLFIGYINFEQKIHQNTRVRELFNDFLGLFSQNFSIWKEYINFENIVHSPRGARTLLHIVLGLDKYLIYTHPHTPQLTSSILLSTTPQLPSATITDTAKYIIPLIQYKQQTELSNQLTNDLSHIEKEKILSTLTNQLPLQRQLAPIISPLVSAQSEVVNMWKIYSNLETQNLHFDTQISSILTQTYNTVNKTVSNGIPSNDPSTGIEWIHQKSNYVVFRPHPNYQMVSFIPYLSTMFPELYNICTAYEMWILSSPLNIEAYKSYAKFWYQYGEQFQNSTQKRILDFSIEIQDLIAEEENKAEQNNQINQQISEGSPLELRSIPSAPSKRPLGDINTDTNNQNSNPTRGNLLNNLLPKISTFFSFKPTDYFVHLFNLSPTQIFLDTLGTSILPNTIPKSLHPLSSNVYNLTEWCRLMGKWVLVLLHERVKNEAILLKKIQDEFLGKINEYSTQIIALDLKSSEDIGAIVDNHNNGIKNEGSDVNTEVTNKLQENNAEISRLSNIVSQLLLHFRGLIEKIYELKLKRRDVLKLLLNFEDLYEIDFSKFEKILNKKKLGWVAHLAKNEKNNTKSSRQQLIDLMPLVVKKSMPIMTPRDISGENDWKDEAMIAESKQDIGIDEKNIAKNEPNELTTSMQVLDTTIQNISQILQTRWVTDKYFFIDLLFPQDTIETQKTTKTTLSKLKMAAKKFKTNSNVAILPPPSQSSQSSSFTGPLDSIESVSQFGMIGAVGNVNETVIDAYVGSNVGASNSNYVMKFDTTENNEMPLLENVDNQNDKNNNDNKLNQNDFVQL